MSEINININGGESSFGDIIQNKKTTKKNKKKDKKINIFLSYRRDDELGIIGRIYDRLSDNFSDGNIFKDVYSINIGEDFKSKIEESIINSDFLLSCIGDNWLGDNGMRINSNDDIVRFELVVARDNDIPIIPVLLSMTKMPIVNELPNNLHFLTLLNATQIRLGSDFEYDMKTLINFLKNKSNSPRR